MRKFLLIIFISLMYSGSSAIAEGCVEGNCNNGKGTYIWDNGNKYVGEFYSGLADGQGTFYFHNGDTNGREKIVGTFRNNKVEGQGIMTFKDGRKYVGEFKNNLFNGEGTFTFEDGTRYVGEFVDNYFQGQGTLTYADGEYCTGKFNKSKCLGKTVKLDRTKRNKIAEAKLACEDLGFTPGTEKFAECALKLSTEGSERTSSNRSSGGGGGVNWGGVVDTVERQRQEIERLNRERSNNGNTRVCSNVGNSIVCKDRGY